MTKPELPNSSSFEECGASPVFVDKFGQYHGDAWIDWKGLCKLCEDPTCHGCSAKGA